MTTETATAQTPEATYRAARAKGGCVDACLAAMRAHGITMDQAQELSWQVEAGKPVPAWAKTPSSPYETPAPELATYERGMEPR